MKLAALVLLALTIGFAFPACKSSSGPKPFCDTVCLKDTLKFIKDNYPLQPYVYISAKDCRPDSLIWSYTGMGVNRKLDFTEMTGVPVRLNKDFVRCVINDTSYAWLLFNDCNGGKGYYFKIPFNRAGKIGRSNRAVNSFDPKFAVTGGLVAYLDPGNIFVEDMTTGKKAMMTFGKDIEPDWDNLHQSIDSVSITPVRIWARFKVEGEWKEAEKKIELK